MRIRILVAAPLMLILVACGGGTEEGEPSTSGTDGESTITTPQPTTTTPSLEAASGPLAGIGEVKEVESSVQLFETEGPQWMPDDSVLLFSDVSGNTIYQVTAK